MKIAIVGATGLVGHEIIKVIEEHNIKVDTLLPVASSKSIGKKILFHNKELIVISIMEAIKQKPDIAIFSAGSTISKQYAKQFAAVGSFVIDNSSAWRMDKNIPLVVPEINASTISEETKIIANPNCSTIQMVVAINPLHKKYGIKRLVISTYQSVSGSGSNAVKQMENERRGDFSNKVYPHEIDLNVIPHGGDFTDNGYTTEEIKLIKETHKILSSPQIKITSTVVRVPVTGGHSESINIEFEKSFDLSEVKEIINNTDGVTVYDTPEKNCYPMPKYAKDKDDVFVGRIRRDMSLDNGINIWVVADNLRKGAATNAVQIAEYLINKKLA